MSSSVLPLIAFLVLLLNTHGQNSSDIAPQGCSYENRKVVCDFQQWMPPLLDKDFKTEPVHDLTLENINGTIPAGAFSGLNGPLENRKTYISLNCNKGKTNLTRDIFTQNLQWVMELEVLNCYLQSELPSRLLESLDGLNDLVVRLGEIELVAHDSLSGLTNLQRITIQAPVKTGTLPSGFFGGLLNLTKITLRNAELDFIPSNLFSGLANLEWISLSYNKLQTLPQGLFDGLNSLTYIFLNGNPLKCTCEFMWLLDWSHIADGAVCQFPAHVANKELQTAIDLLNCLPSTPSPLSVPVSPLTEMTTLDASFSFTLAVTAVPVVGNSILSSQNRTRTIATSTPRHLVSRTATSTQIESLSAASRPKINAVSMTSTATMILTAVSVTEDTSVLTTILKSTTMPLPMASWKALTAAEEGITNTPSSLATAPTSQSRLLQAVFSSTPAGSWSLNSNINNDAVLDIHKIGLISGSAALTLLVTAAFLSRYVYRNKCVRR